MLITGVTELKSRLTLSMRSSLERREMELKLTRTSLSHNAGIRTGRAEAVLRQIRSRLEGLSPYGVLSRGYAMIYSTAGDMISSAKAFGEVNLITREFEDYNIGDLRGLSDDIKARCKSTMMVFVQLWTTEPR